MSDEVSGIIYVVDRSSGIPHPHITGNGCCGGAVDGCAQQFTGNLLPVVACCQRCQLGVHLVLGQRAPPVAFIEQEFALCDAFEEAFHVAGIFLTNHIVLEGPLLIVNHLACCGKVGKVCDVLAFADGQLCASLHGEGVLVLILLCGDDDDTVCRACAPDACRRSVLKDGDALHIIGVDALQCAHVRVLAFLCGRIVHDGESVNDDEGRVVGKHGTGTAYAKGLSAPSVIL